MQDPCIYRGSERSHIANSEGLPYYVHGLAVGKAAFIVAKTWQYEGENRVFCVPAVCSTRALAEARVKRLTSNERDVPVIIEVLVEE